MKATPLALRVFEINELPAILALKKLHGDPLERFPQSLTNTIILISIRALSLGHCLIVE